MRARSAVLLATLLVTVSAAAVLPPSDPASALAAGDAVPVHLDGTVHALTAEPHTILDDDVRPRLLGADATQPVPETDGYVGHLSGMPGATVRLVVDEEVRGIVLGPDGAGWWLASADGRVEATPLAEMPSLPDHHGLADDAMPGSTAETPTVDAPAGPASPPGVLLELRLALEADHRFYEAHNETWSEEMLEAFQLVEGIYRSHLGVTFNVTWIGAWEEPDPYDAVGLCGWDGTLRQFRDHWEANRDDVPRHNAYLTVGSPRGAGCAYVRDVDTDWAYAVSDWGAPGWVPESFTYWRMILQAHELGHNFAGEHHRSVGGCGEGTIMAPCYGWTAPTFSLRSDDGGEGNLLPMRAYAEDRLPIHPLVREGE